MGAVAPTIKRHDGADVCADATVSSMGEKHSRNLQNNARDTLNTDTNALSSKHFPRMREIQDLLSINKNQQKLQQ